MNQDEKNAMIANFVDMTQSGPEEAIEMLEASNWQLGQAVLLFYGESDQRGAGTPSTAPSVTRPTGSSIGQASSHSAGSSSGSAPPKRFATFSDLSQSISEEDGSNSPSDEDDNLFTGGEKSGLAVQNPGSQGGGHGSGAGSSAGSGSGGSTYNRLIHDIFRQSQSTAAAEQSAGVPGGAGIHSDTADQAAARNAFRGTGFTLGSDEVESRAIPDPDEAAAQLEQRARGGANLQPVDRRITFWRDGFTVDDGPLNSYDDPVNIQHLEAIRSGRAPLALLNAELGQPVNVHVERVNQNYKPPVKPRSGFSGQGQRLGSPVPGEIITNSSVSSSQEPASSPVPNTASSSLGTTGDAQVQLRLGSGRPERLRFDSTGPVQQIYDYIDSTAPQSRPYVLMTTFPNKELTDRSATLKEAKIVGAVVVQKFI